jgi:branched-chain amino acid transport system substrate-binding protein
MRCSTWKLLGLLGITLLTAAPTRAEVRIGLAAPMAWAGDQNWRGAEVAVADLNARGGVLGEQIELITADDYCEGEQAVAAANKLVAAGVVAVLGHVCSGAAIPASRVYSDAGLLMISNFATNPKLTEQGFTNVFRVVGRDDLQGRIGGDLLAERWGNKPIAILHDGQAYGKGLAEEIKKRLNERAIAEAMFEAIEPGKADYWDVVQAMRAKGVEVLYYGGYSPEAALIIRQAHEHGYKLQLVAGDGISQEDFGLIAGPTSDGTLMTYPPVPVHAQAVELGRRFSDIVQPPFHIYATFQVWARAVEIAGTFETQAVAKDA